ncbi:hypothetical protein SUDANB95_06982 [Actinosynnema sp. ALI-1.44]
MTLDEPTMAGVHDGLLGGIANYDPDRRLVEEVAARSPLPVRLEREHRAFVRRAAARVAAVGQVLDLGCGAPRDDSVFELVDCPVACVDVDPDVVAHTTLAAEGRDNVAVLRADVRDPEVVLGLVDVTRPVGVLMLSVLQYVPDADGPAELVADYLARLAPGSVLVLSHPSADTAPELHAVAALLPGRPTLRTRAEVAALLPAGTPVVPVPCLFGDDSGPGDRYPYYAAVVRC